MNSPFLPLAIGQLRKMAANAVSASPGTTATVQTQIDELDRVTTLENAACWPKVDILSVLTKRDNPVSIIAGNLLQSMLDLAANQP